MSIFNKSWAFIKEIANISEHLDTQAAQKAIRSNIYFRGPNVWILALSIVIASVGLNVNSIPVIIGAMLISPLMGPIFGIGLGVGISDLPLIRDSFKNLLVMVTISLLASTLYFLISPLNLYNPTELLARTNPTIYDVIIAFFGGLAGILEMSRKEKGTVFSGVAIATALMPPLCTAGFGLASGNIMYFLGALYLFTINCIFIILATYIMVKYMKFADVEFESIRRKRQVKTCITIVITVFIIPSIWSAVVMVKENNFNKNVSEFIAENRAINKAYIYDYKISHHKGSKVEIFVSGETMTAADKTGLAESAKKHGIHENQLIINDKASAEALKESELVKGIYERSDSEISRRDEKIRELEKTIGEMSQNEIPYVQITREITNQYPAVREAFISRGASVKKGKSDASESVFILLKTMEPLTVQEKERLKSWLKIRLNTENIILHEEHSVNAD